MLAALANARGNELSLASAVLSNTIIRYRRFGIVAGRTGFVLPDLSFDELLGLEGFLKGVFD
jgi:hypothetical protein